MSNTKRLCPKCGSPVADDLRMCLSCGQAMEPRAAPPLISRVPGARPHSPAPSTAPPPPMVVPPAQSQPQAPAPGLPWGAPILPRPPTQQAGVSYVLVFDTGQRVAVRGPGLIGRNPGSTDKAVTCTSIKDPTMSVSKIHLEYGLDAQGLWVTDRGSTNGSTLQKPGLAPSRLIPGQVVHLDVGDSVGFGQRSVRVEGV